MNRKGHPITDFAYFTAVIAFGMIFMHPLCIIISFCSGLAHSLILKKKSGYVLFVMLAAAISNPVFNHAGVTILCYLPGGNPLTAESVIYGIAASGMFGATLLHFSCFNEVFTSDKLIDLFGKTAPAVATVLSVTLRFVPELSKSIKATSVARRAGGMTESETTIFKKAKNGLDVLSSVISQGLESAAQTADCMKSRGYGLPGHTSYSNFKFRKTDKKILSAIAVLSAYVIFEAISGTFYFKYYPAITVKKISHIRPAAFSAYAVLCFLPVMCKLWEEIKWKKLKSKN